jgi:hypothetical protein
MIFRGESTSTTQVQATPPVFRRRRPARSRARLGATVGVAVAVAAAGAMALSMISAGAASASTNAAHAAAPSLLFGTLDTQTSTAATEAHAGVSVAMFELNWASFEPKKGVFSASYLATMQSDLEAYRAAGMRVTLGLGLQNAPSWVFSLADSTYVDQNGAVSSEADFVFSEAVRQAAASYLTQVAAGLPLSNFWAIRLTSGGDGEMLYPSGGTYWAFSNAALTGVGLPPTTTPNPFPNWRPGRPGLTPAQTDQWMNWYIGGLDNVTNWQMRTLSGLSFTGYYQLVTPGSGTRPDVLAQEEQQNLVDGVTGVGAVWDRYYAMLPDKANVVAYVSSVADGSGGNGSCQPADNSLPLTSNVMNSWPATRWISRVAAADGLAVAGENPGYGMPASLDSEYTNTSSTGMMAAAIRQATSCGFQAFYWAHDYHLWDGTVPFSLYASHVASVDPPVQASPSTTPSSGGGRHKGTHGRSRTTASATLTAAATVTPAP